jgi:hypothetical protein
MKCAQARRLFGPYWDDEITQAEREWLEAHLNACSPCRAGYDDFARSLELVTTLPREEAAPDIVEKTLARARRLMPAPDLLPAGRPSWVPVAAGAAAVAAMALLALPWSGVMRGPAPERTATIETEQVAMPERVAVTASPGERQAPSGAGADRADVAVLFDHNEDVEFVLDPVALRRGRAHPISQASSREDAQVERSVISF